MKYLMILAVSYLLGSVPFGLLMGKWWSKIDVREYGSGNIGMTNVLRTTGYLPALLTLLGDAGKGVLAVFLARAVTTNPALYLLAGTCAVIGHNCPLFLKFRGGKGVATVAGVLLASRPLVALILLVIWIGVLLIYRYISLASVVVAFCLPFVLLLFKVNWPEFALAVVVATLTIYKHRTNIERLRQGTEFRLGQKVKP